MKFLCFDFKNSTPRTRWIFQNSEPGPSAYESVSQEMERQAYIDSVKDDMQGLKLQVMRAQAEAGSIGKGENARINKEKFKSPFRKNTISQNVSILKKLAEGEAIFDDLTQSKDGQEWGTGEEAEYHNLFGHENNESHAFENQKEFVINAMPNDAIGRFMFEERDLALELFTDQSGGSYKVDFYGHEGLEAPGKDWLRRVLLPKDCNYIKIINNGTEEIASLFVGFNKNEGKYKASFRTLDGKIPEVKTGTIITPVNRYDEDTLLAEHPTLKERTAKKEDFEAFQDQERSEHVAYIQDQVLDESLAHFGSGEIADNFINQLTDATGDKNSTYTKKTVFNFVTNAQFSKISAKKTSIKRLIDNYDLSDPAQKTEYQSQLNKANQELREMHSHAVDRLISLYSKNLINAVLAIEENTEFTDSEKSEKFEALKSLEDEIFSVMNNRMTTLTSRTEKARDQNSIEIKNLISHVRSLGETSFSGELEAQLLEAIDSFDRGEGVGEDELITMLVSFSGKETTRDQFLRLITKRNNINRKQAALESALNTRLNKEKVISLAMNPEFRATIRENQQLIGDELTQDLLHPPFIKNEDGSPTDDLDIVLYKKLLGKARAKLLSKVNHRNEEVVYPVLEHIQEILGKVEAVEAKMKTMDIAEDSMEAIQNVEEELNSEDSDLAKRLKAAHQKLQATGEIDTDVWQAHKKAVASENASTFTSQLSFSPTFVDLTSTEQKNVANTLSSLPDGTVLTGIDPDGNPVIQLGPNGSLAKVDLNRTIPQIIVKPAGGVDGEKVEMDLTKENAPVAAITAAVMNARVIDNTSTQVEKFEATGFDFGYIKFVKNMLGVNPRYPQTKELEGLQQIEREHPGGFLGYMGNTLGGYDQKGQIVAARGSEVKDRFWDDMSAAASGVMPSK